ncbi:MAG: methyltransferase domain-containing protein [DPANN group archaeon]|nr:methyltransferase domain-containing protein [DPANN group archaeon]
MALTDKLGTVFYFSEGYFRRDRQLARYVYQPVFERLQDTGAISGRLKILDLGSGPNGSDFVNMLAEFSPQLEVTYADYHWNYVNNMRMLGKKAVVSDGRKMSFMDDSFDIVFGGWSVLESNGTRMARDSKVIAEVRRVLCRQGIFIFEYAGGGDYETGKNFRANGFSKFTHLLRLERSDREFLDLYSASA